MTVGSNLPCCCGTPGGACTDIDIDVLPDEVSVSIAFTVQYAMTFYRVFTIRTANFRSFDPLFDSPGDDIYGPNNDQVCCFPFIVTRDHEIDAQYTASLSMQISGTLLKSPFASEASSRLYQGQLAFEYEFDSDAPDTASISGGITPASPGLPTNQAGYQGIAARLSCDASAGAYARGMLRPYRGLDPSQDPDSIVASGSMLRLSTSYVFNGWQPGGGSETPPTETGGSRFIRSQQIPFPPIGQSDRVTGIGKLNPLQTHWTRQASPVIGAYEPVRVGTSLSGALAVSTAFDSFPRTKPLMFKPDTTAHANCSTFRPNEYGPADQEDPDWLPNAGGWILADECVQAEGSTGYTDPFGRCPDIPAVAGPSCLLCSYGAVGQTVPEVGEPCFPNGYSGQSPPIPPYEPEYGSYYTKRQWMTDMSAEVSA